MRKGVFFKFLVQVLVYVVNKILPRIKSFDAGLVSRKVILSGLLPFVQRLNRRYSQGDELR